MFATNFSNRRIFMTFSRTFKKPLVGYLIGIIFLVSCLVSQPLFGATKKLRMQVIFPAASIVFQEVKNFAETVKQRTNGEIAISVYPPGALVKATEVFDSVKRGTIDMAFSASLYHARKMPEGLFEFSLPFSFPGAMFTHEASNRHYDFFYEWRGGIVGKMFDEIYAKHKIKLLATGPSSSYGIMTNFPVKRLSDFKGKKIRTFGLYSVIAKKLGASPVSIPAADQYLALQRGTIGGTIYPYRALLDYKLDEVLDYAILPPPGIPVVDIYMNIKTFKSLPSKTQAVIEKAAMEHMKIFTGKVLSVEEGAIENAKKKGLKVVTLPAEDVEKLKEISRSTWPIVTKKSEKCAELVGLLKEYLKEKGL
jgi:TRAP-type C4-dicarboxylate transport system substrate-binding protein